MHDATSVGHLILVGVLGVVVVVDGVNDAEVEQEAILVKKDATNQPPVLGQFKQ